jgi:hypothetical protein
MDLLIPQAFHGVARVGGIRQRQTEPSEHFRFTIVPLAHSQSVMNFHLY